MRRLLRILINGLTLLSLLLCAATCVLWVRSYVELQTIYYQFHTDSYEQLGFGSKDGRTETGWIVIPNPSFPVAKPGFHFEVDPHDVGEIPQRTFKIRALGNLKTEGSYHVLLPHWFLAVVFSVLPVSYLIYEVRGRNRKLTGLCPTCGYDLRATPARCPECGAVPAAKAIA